MNRAELQSAIDRKATLLIKDPNTPAAVAFTPTLMWGTSQENAPVDGILCSGVMIAYVTVRGVLVAERISFEGGNALFVPNHARELTVEDRKKIFQDFI